MIPGSHLWLTLYSLLDMISKQNETPLYQTHFWVAKHFTCEQKKEEG